MSTRKRNWERENVYIGSRQSGRRPGPGQSRSCLLTRCWILNLVHVQDGYTAAGRRGRGTSPIEENSGNDDGDCCYAADYSTSDGTRT